MDSNSLDIILDEIKQSEGSGFTYDRQKIEADINEQESLFSDLSVKILSVIGGVLSAALFLVFLLLLGIYKEEAAAVILGVILLALAVLGNNYFNKVILDALTVSIFIVSLVLLAIGLYDAGKEVVATVYVIVGGVVMLLTKRSYMLLFLSTLLIAGGIFILLLSTKSVISLHFFVALLIGFYTFISFWESKIIAYSPKLNYIYEPVKMGTLLFSIAMFVGMGWSKKFNVDFNLVWISSLIIGGAVMFTLSKIIEISKIETLNSKLIVYLSAVVILIPTLFYPSIVGAILILLISYYVGHITGGVLGLLALAYFIIQFYYDLQMTLLLKSIILFASGSVLIGLFFIVTNQLKGYETD